MQRKYAKEIRAAKLEEFKSYLDNDAIRLTDRRRLNRDVNLLTVRENELREDRERRQATTHSEGSTRYAYQSGDTVHGKVDAHKSQQQEELNEVLRKARTNPWHLFAHGVLHRTDGSGQRMFSTFDDPLVKVTPWHTLSKEMRTLLGGEYNWASWMSHPLSGYSLHFFLKAFELGKLQGNYLVELNHKPRVYTGGYRSPYEKYSNRHVG